MDKNQIIEYGLKGLGFACVSFAAVAVPVGLFTTVGNFVTAAEQLANGVIENDLLRYQANSVMALGAGAVAAAVGTGLMVLKPR